jgi:tellurite methyltransferase
MASEDLARWETCWRARAEKPGPPEPFLVEQLKNLRPGHVLDVAAGCGRNALMLARAGFRVTAVDIAPTALARLATQAAGEGLEIATLAVDLDEPQALDGLGPFDGLVVVRYRPSPAQWPRVLGRLRPGGLLLLCSFGPAQARRTGFPRAFCLEREELTRELPPELDCVLWRSFEQDGDALEGSLWRKCRGLEQAEGR